MLVATRDLESGTILGPGDVTLASYPPDLAPRSALATAADAVGHQLRQGVPEGTPVLPFSLADDGWGLAPGEVAVPVRLADPLVADLFEAGDRLELVRADGEATASLTPDARILALLAEPTGAGLFGGGSASPSPLALVAVPRAVATAILDSSARGTLTAALVPAPG